MIVNLEISDETLELAGKQKGKLSRKAYLELLLEKAVNDAGKPANNEDKAVKQLPVEDRKEIKKEAVLTGKAVPPPGLKGIDLTIWKSENK